MEAWKKWLRKLFKWLRVNRLKVWLVNIRLRLHRDYKFFLLKSLRIGKIRSWINLKRRTSAEV